MLVKDAPHLRSRCLGLADASGHRLMWRGMVEGMDEVLGRYIRALLILSSVTLICYALFFSVLGVPYGLFLAAVGGVLEFIPVAGPAVAAIAALLVAGLSGYDHLLWLLGGVGAYRLLQDYVLNPYLMGGGVAVPALLVLLGLLAGEELGGIVGIFLSVPALAAAKVALTQIQGEWQRLAAAPAHDRATTTGT